MTQWASDVLSDDSATAAGAIERLRAAGPDGLEALKTVHRDRLATGVSGRLDRHDADWKKLQTALDAVGAQRNCATSGLYWHTDLPSALAAAKAAHKPVLSLRLLGKLTDELSCANSRYFRTTLYANRQVARALSERFVLHWQSVRPVPQVTIDFGDGRKLVRTVTGNSIHYILDENGRVVDALPGLYGPAAFLRGLDEAERAVHRAVTLDDIACSSYLNEYHQIRLTSLLSEWQEDLSRVGFRRASATQPVAFVQAQQLAQAQQQQQRAQPAAAPNARQAGQRAVSKTVVEARVVDVAVPNAPAPAPAQPPSAVAGSVPAPATIDDLEALTREETWVQIAALHAGDAQLDENSKALIAAKFPNAATAGERAESKRRVENPLVKLVRRFQESVALDTVKNEYRFHSRIHQWLAAGVPGVDELNERVYAELFLTPSSDPWLGLLPADAYTAVDNGGIVQ